jgi:uncharacterized protein (TIGR02145 family)
LFDNSSGFAGLPGGYRLGNGAFDVVSLYGNWWSATESSTTVAWYRLLGYNFGSLGRSDYNKQSGFSVRCLRD